MFVIFSTRIISIFLGILTVSLISRLLGPEGKGAYALLLLAPSFLILLGEMGVGMSNVYFIGHRKHEHSQIASNSLILGTCLGSLLVVCFLIYFLIFQPHFLEGLTFWPLFIATLTIPLSLLAGYFQSILLGQNRIVELSFLALAQGGIFLLFLTVIALLHVKNPLLYTISAWTMTLGIIALFFIILVHRATPITLSFYPQLLKDSVRFGIKGYLGNLIGALNYRLDLFIVASFLNVAAVGYYSASASLAETLWYLPGAVGTLVFAQTPRLKVEDTNRLTPIICRTTLLATILMTIVLFVFRKPLVLLLFGAPFLPALQSFGILLPGVIALSISKVLGNEIAGRGRPMLNTIAVSVSLAIDIVLNILFVPTMGIAGAALASTVSYIAASIIVVTNFLKLSHNTWTKTLLPQREDIAFYLKTLAVLRNFCSPQKSSQ